MIAQLNKEYLKVGGFKKVILRLISYIIEGRPLTTRGRFINLILIPLFKLISRINFKKKTEKIYILGQGRSGSTYLGLLLSMIPSSIFLNEPKLLWSIANKEDDLIGSYTKNGSFHIDTNNKQISKKIENIYSFISLLTGTSKIIDKYPEMIYRTGWLNSNIYSINYILLYRDYKSVIKSIPNWNKKHKKSDVDWWGKNNRKWNLIQIELLPKCIMLKDLNIEFTTLNDIEKSIVEWILTVDQSIKLIDHNFDNISIINYNDLKISLEIYTKKQNIYSQKLFKYFNETYRETTNNLKIENCKIELIEVAEKLEQLFKHKWINYKSKYLV